MRCPDQTTRSQDDWLEEDAQQRQQRGRHRHWRCAWRAGGLGRAGVLTDWRSRKFKAMLSLPATKGFEIGSGFGGMTMTGLEHNDPFP